MKEYIVLLSNAGKVDWCYSSSRLIRLNSYTAQTLTKSSSIMSSLERERQLCRETAVLNSLQKDKVLVSLTLWTLLDWRTNFRNTQPSKKLFLTLLTTQLVDEDKSSMSSALWPNTRPLSTLTPMRSTVSSFLRHHQSTHYKILSSQSYHYHPFL